MNDGMTPRVTRRRFLQTAAAGGAAFLAPPFAGGQPKKLEIVKGTFTTLVAYAPLFAAVDKGFFAKYGIENQISNVAITASLPLVARGDYDWGRSTNGPGYFNAINSGLAIVGVVDRLTYACSADNVLSVSTKAWETGVRAFEDLKGKTVAHNAPGTATEYWHTLNLRRTGLKATDMRIVYLNYPDMLAALSTGGADAGYLPEPLVTKGVLEGKIKPILHMHKVAPGDNIGMIFFGRKFIEKQNGDLAVRWVMAYLEGARFAQDRKNRDEVIQLVAKWTRVEERVLQTAYDGKLTWPQVNPNGHVDVEHMLRGQGEYFLKTGQVDKLPAPRQIYDPRFVNEALKVIGEVPFDRYQLCKA